MFFSYRVRVATGACILACTFVAAPEAMAASVTVNQGNLGKAMAAAQPGDTLVLSPGGYGVVILPRKTWQKPITIDARAATLAGLVFFKTSGVNWVGGAIVGSNYAVTISGSEQIGVTGTDISGAVRGIVINNSSDLKIVRNKLHGLQVDGIDVVGQRILIESNVITDMRPKAGDHPDGIQLWSANNEQTSDITIRGNSVTGSSQGIFGGAAVLGMKNIVVTGNKVQVAYGNGIVLGNLHNSVATGNTVSSTADRLNRANMRIEGTNIVACGNIVRDVPNAIPAQPCKS